MGGCALFQEIINNRDDFQVVSHIMPDGDSIGSTVALTRALTLIGKKADAFSLDAVPRKYRFLDKKKIIKAGLPDSNANTLLVLDCSDFTRTGMEAKARYRYNHVVNIDHHVTNNLFGTVNIVQTGASATGEILYKLFKKVGLPLDKDIAEALYTAIVTDTGSFKYENTTPETHRVAANLLDFNLDASISQRVFDEYPVNYLLLLKQALSTLELLENRKIACLTITEEMRLQCGASMEILDGMVNYAKNIEGVEIGILIYLNGQNEIKVGMRSKEVDVSKIADRFQGGGHQRAAGFKVKGPYGETKEIIIETLKEYL